MDTAETATPGPARTSRTLSGAQTQLPCGTQSATVVKVGAASRACPAEGPAAAGRLRGGRKMQRSPLRHRRSSLPHARDTGHRRAASARPGAGRIATDDRGIPVGDQPVGGAEYDALQTGDGLVTFQPGERAASTWGISPTPPLSEPG